LVLALFVATALASCGDDQPTGPGNFPDVRGDWGGQYSVTECEVLTGNDPFFCTDLFFFGRSLALDVVLDQSNESLNGNAVQGTVAGQVSGTVDMSGLITLGGTLGADAIVTTTIEDWETELVGDSLVGVWQFLVQDNQDIGFGSARVTADMTLITPNVLSYLGCPVQSWLSQPDSISGVLDAGDCMLPDTTYFDVYAMDVEVGDSVEFRMASQEFGPFLIITDVDGDPLRADGGLGDSVASAGIEAEFDETWLVIANVFLSNESGSYRLVTTKINGATPPSTVVLRRVPIGDWAALRDGSRSDPSALESVREFLGGKFATRSTSTDVSKLKRTE